MRMLQSICTMLTLMFFLSAAHAAGPAATEVIDCYKAWDAAFNKGDAKALADLYDEDLVFLPANHEIIRDRRNLEKFFAALFKMGVTNHRLELIEAGGAGDMIFGAAKWSADGKDKEERPALGRRDLACVHEAGERHLQDLRFTPSTDVEPIGTAEEPRKRLCVLPCRASRRGCRSSTEAAEVLTLSGSPSRTPRTASALSLIPGAVDGGPKVL